MHLAPLIIDLAIILAVAGLMSFVFQKIKQPVVLGYILAGVIVGPHTPPFQLVRDIPNIQTWAELGVIFLMFTLGLEFSFRKLLSVGLTAVIAAGLEVLFFLFVGYWIGSFLGWGQMDSIFLGAMLSISSTTIIIKALDELKLKSHRFAGLIFGILIVEDLFAILLLVGLGTIATTKSFSLMSMASTLLTLVLVVGSWFIIGYFLVPRLITYVGKLEDKEMLALVSVGLCLGLAVIAVRFGYSPALGAFIIGSILAETKLIHQIEKLMLPLKDLFGAIFFVSIGLMIDPAMIWKYKETILLLSVVTIVGKIFITSSGALLSGQTFKNSLQVGLGLAQIGEFSFIIAGLGLSLKVIDERLYPIGVAVSLVTTFTTPYLIRYSGPLAEKLEAKLPWWTTRLLRRYSDWWNHRNPSHSYKWQELLTILSRWFLNGIIVTVIFEVVLEYFPYGETHGWKYHVAWPLAFVLSLPFIWGMVFTSRKNYLRIRKERNLPKLVLVVSLPVMTSLWIGVLSTEYFSSMVVLPVTFVILMIVYFFLFKKLETHYRWLEKTFLASFEDQSEEGKSEVTQLAPWDYHLVRISVHPNATFANASLIETNLRQKFGVNVVAIERGLRTIVAPKPEEKILPGDVLVTLGTDEKLLQARPFLEIPEKELVLEREKSNYLLRHFRVGPDSRLSGLTIRNSGIRETYHAMVVGIERSQKRIVNPDTDFEIAPNDILWVVGEEKLLDELIQGQNSV